MTQKKNDPTKAEAVLRKKLIRLAAENPELQPKLLPLLKQSSTRGETFPDVKALVHSQGVTLDIEVGITGQGMGPGAACDRIKTSVELIRNVMNKGLMKAAQEASGSRVNPQKFNVLQGQYPWLVRVGTYLYMPHMSSEKVGAVVEAIRPFIKRQYLEYKK